MAERNIFDRIGIRDDPHAALWEELSQNTYLQKQNKVLKEKVAKQAKQDKAVKNAKVSKKTIDGKTYYITDVPITSKDLVPYAMVEEKNKEIESLKKQIKARLDDIANKDRTIRTLEYRAKNDLEKVKREVVTEKTKVTKLKNVNEKQKAQIKDLTDTLKSGIFVQRRQEVKGNPLDVDRFAHIDYLTAEDEADILKTLDKPVKKPTKNTKEEPVPKEVEIPKKKTGKKKDKTEELLINVLAKYPKEFRTAMIRKIGRRKRV